jgi:hypothetical protein
MRTARLDDARRLARHLWRMCYALFIASMSFFLGQTDEIPEALRITPLLVLLAFLPALVMLYWLWRVRYRRGIDLMSRSDASSHGASSAGSRMMRRVSGGDRPHALRNGEAPAK